MAAKRNLRRRRDWPDEERLNSDGWWLPFLDTYRTLCLGPSPEFRRVLEEVGEMDVTL
jgi:hypothetical protein